MDKSDGADNRNDKLIAALIDDIGAAIEVAFVNRETDRLAEDLTRCFQKYSTELLQLEIDRLREAWDEHEHIEIVRRSSPLPQPGSRRLALFREGIFSQAVRLYKAWLPKHRNDIVNTIWRQAISIACTRQHDRVGGQVELKWNLGNFNREVRSRCADSVRAALEPLIVSFLGEAHAMEVGALEQAIVQPQSVQEALTDCLNDGEEAVAAEEFLWDAACEEAEVDPHDADEAALAQIRAAGAEAVATRASGGSGKLERVNGSSTPHTVAKKKRGRPQTIADEKKTAAADLKASGGTNKQAAILLYGTKHPTDQQKKNVPAILRHHQQKSKRSGSPVNPASLSEAL